MLVCLFAKNVKFLQSTRHTLNAIQDRGPEEIERIVEK